MRKQCRYYTLPNRPGVKSIRKVFILYVIISTADMNSLVSVTEKQTQSNMYVQYIILSPCSTAGCCSWWKRRVGKALGL